MRPLQSANIDRSTVPTTARHGRVRSVALRDDLPDRILRHPGLIHDYRKNAALVIRNDAGLLLFCERLGHPGWWQFPQGGVEPDELPEHAAFREAGEELGLADPRASLRIEDRLDEPLRYDFDVEVIERFLNRKGYSYVGQAQHFFLAHFIGEEHELTLRPPPGCDPEFSQWQWAGPEFVESVPAFKREVARQALRHFGFETAG